MQKSARAFASEPVPVQTGRKHGDRGIRRVEFYGFSSRVKQHASIGALIAARRVSLWLVTFDPPHGYYQVGGWGVPGWLSLDRTEVDFSVLPLYSNCAPRWVNYLQKARKNFRMTNRELGEWRRTAG